MLNIQTSQHENVTLVEAAGRVDSSNANQFSEALTHVINDGHRQLVLDLSGVEYMSSAGLREIVSAVKKLNRQQGDLRLAQPSPRVMEVLELTGLDTALQIFSSPSEAISSY
jgi:anti-sigma B factor antagonist